MPPLSFPIKLWNILDICPRDLIRWSDDGREVYVNEDRFEDLIEQFPSFLRQPTLSSLRHLFAVYEFHREDRSRLRAGWTCYSHPYFVRGRSALLELFVLSHQTRRYSMRKAKGDDTDVCKRQKTPDSAEMFTRDFVTEIDSTDDLQPIYSSSLFQFTFCAGLDDESDNAEAEQPPFKHQRQAEEEYHFAYCSTIIETDVDGSDVSFCPQEVVRSNSATWMSDMNEKEEWFGMKDQPLAVPVPVSNDCAQHDIADNAVPTTTSNCASLVQMQHYDDMQLHVSMSKERQLQCNWYRV